MEACASGELDSYSQSASVRALPYMEGVNYMRCNFPRAHGSGFQQTGSVFISNTVCSVTSLQAPPRLPRGVHK